MIRADLSHPLNFSSSAAAPVITGCALSSAPAIPNHAPGPTPPGTVTVPPNRTVSNASKPTKTSTSSRYGTLSHRRRRLAAAALNRALDELQEPATASEITDSKVTANSTASRVVLVPEIPIPEYRFHGRT